MESLEFTGQLAWTLRDTVSIKKGKLPEDQHSRFSPDLHTHTHFDPGKQNSTERLSFVKPFRHLLPQRLVPAWT